MTISNLEEIKQKYFEYLNLYFVKSRNDPEEEPFKSKYEARKLIESLLADLDPNLPTSSSSQDENDTEIGRIYQASLEKLNDYCSKTHSSSSKSFLIKKLLEFNLARNFIDTEETEYGEKLLSKLVRELKSMHESLNVPYDDLTINLKLSSFNDLVYVWSTRGDYKKCLSLMQTIEETYESYRGSNKSCLPFDPSEIISLNVKSLSTEKRRANFEGLYTHSLFFFAQVYGKLDEKEKSATYCQLTLQRQLNEHVETVNDVNSADQPNDGAQITEQPQERVVFNPLDWATHSAAISQYFVAEDDFATARHCLCCAEAILKVLNEKEKENPSDRLSEQTASIKRCWGKYAIELLKMSKRKLLESTEHPDQRSLLAELDKPSRFRFRLAETKYPLAECEKAAITSNLALDFEQAKTIFLKAQSILNETRSFFKLDGYVTDHCEITRDLSDLYSCLMFFEEDSDRKCKMNKRRLDLLKPVCDEINEQYYLTLKRQLLFDVGSILSEMVDLKLDILHDKKSPPRDEIKNAVSKINSLVGESLGYFEKFLDTMKVQPERNRLPEKFDDHNVRPALLAKFYIGRLYSKYINTDPSKKLANMKSTLDAYSYLVAYCEKLKEQNDESLFNQMVNEYNVCKDMVFLMPNEMEKVKNLIV